MELADHEVGVLAADPIIDNVGAQRIELPFAIDDELVLEPRRLAEVQRVMEYAAVIDLFHNREIACAAPLVEFAANGNTLRMRVVVDEGDRGAIDHGGAERTHNFKESSHVFAVA